MKKIFTILLIWLFQISFVNANEINNVIKDSNLELKSIVSIYAKENTKNKIIYKKNENKLLNPASTLKTLTFGASYLTLGKDYKFKTIVYKDSDNNLYLKLGADTLLTHDDLFDLFKKVKKNTNIANIKTIYIDDSIIDNIPYPDNWMQEDIWPYQREITPYVIDNNLVDIALKRSSLATYVNIIQDNNYKMPIINELKLGNKQEYKIVKDYGSSNPIINIKGTINKDEILKLPVVNPKIHFVIKLQNVLDKLGYNYSKKIMYSKVPTKAIYIASVEHSIQDISKNILHNSDNFSSEIVFKVAGANYNKKNYGSTQNGIDMFYNIYQNQLSKGIKITDASGVSRSNLISAKFLADAFYEITSKTDLKDLMLTSNQGTLKDRMLFLEGNLKAKTGTARYMSSIIGNLETRRQKDIDFVIIVQNSEKRNAVLKNFEDNIISILYTKY